MLNWIFEKVKGVDVKVLQEQVILYEKQVYEQQKEIRDITKNSNLNKARQKRQKHISDNLRLKINELESSLAAQKKEVGILNQRIQSDNQHNEECKSFIEQLKLENKKYIDDNRLLTKTINDDQDTIKRLKSEHLKLLQDVNQSTSMNEKLQNLNCQLEEENKIISQNSKKYQSNANCLQISITDLENQLDESKNEFNKLESSLVQARTSLKECQTELSLVQSELSGAQSELLEKDAALVQARASLEENQAQLSQMESKLLSKAKETNQYLLKIDLIEKQITEQKHTLEESGRLQLEKVETENKKLLARIDLLQQQKTELKSFINCQKEDISKLTKINQDKTAEVEELQIKIINVTSEITDKNQLETKNLKQKIDYLSRQNEDLNKIKAELQASLSVEMHLTTELKKTLESKDTTNHKSASYADYIKELLKAQEEKMAKLVIENGELKRSMVQKAENTHISSLLPRSDDQECQIHPKSMNLNVELEKVTEENRKFQDTILELKNRISEQALKLGYVQQHLAYKESIIKSLQNG